LSLSCAFHILTPTRRPRGMVNLCLIAYHRCYTPSLGATALIHIAYGEDDFAVKDFVARIKREYGGAESGDSNTVRLEGSKTTPREIIAASHTIPFLAPKRLVIIEGLFSRFEKQSRGGRGKSKAQAMKDWETLPDQLRAMPESTILVLIDGKLDKANPLLQTLSPIASVKECVPMSVKGPELGAWVRSRAKASGCDISPRAQRLLIDLIGNDLWILSNEIEKLCLYTGGKRIEESDINLLVSYVKEANIFTMVDAIVERRLAVASRLAHQLLDDGASPTYLMHMVTRQFRFLIQMKELMTQNVPAGAIGKRIGLSSGFALEKTTEQAHLYSMDRLREAYRKLLDADVSVKTGALNPVLALDLLITELCA